MIKKLTYLVLNIFFFSKKKFTKPPKKKFLIYDGDNSKYILKYLKSKDVNIVFYRFTQRIETDAEINLFILFKTIINLKFSFGHYVKYFIEQSQPKLILTAIDNNIFFYRLNGKNKFKKISIQQSFRSTQNDLFSNNLTNRKKLDCDYILTFNNHFGKIYNKFINSRIIQVGSFKSNYFKKKNVKKIYDILYVSSFKGHSNDDIYIKKQNITYGDYRKGEVRILQNLKKFIKKNNLNLTILGCKYKTLYKEQKYWENILKNIKYKFIPQKKNRNTYGIIDRAKVLISIDSSLGYESLARGNKVCFFSVRGKKYPLNSSKFGWPQKLANKGFFWTDSTSFKETSRILINSYFTSDKQYQKKTKKIIPNQILFDSGNQIFQRLINDLKI